MKRLACAIAVVAACLAIPTWAAEQAPKIQDVSTPPAQAAGLSLAAAAINLVYFPARLLVTVATAGVGGFAGWMSGGDCAAAHAVWNATEGQAFITPRILEGRERLQFGVAR